MAHKRPFDDEVVDAGSSKHQRQDEYNGKLSLCNESYSIEAASRKSFEIGESSVRKNGPELHQEPEKGSSPAMSSYVLEDGESDAPRSASLSHWVASRASDDDELPEGFQLPFYPGYFNFDPSVRPVINQDDAYYCLLDYPPRKRVPIGLDHQADIPTWGTQAKDITSYGLGTIEPIASDGLSVGYVGGKWYGTCIIPGPKDELPSYDSEKVGHGRVDCSCPDQGSIRCVRQHIAEARDDLKRTLGEDTFTELGFGDMGEVVAEKWSEEEGQLFREIVYSNPASQGKNFWNVLSAVFSSRTNMEIVSYYFNVFLLRVRADMNRCDPMKADSDNDEWHGSDDDGGDEGGVSEDDEDSSGIESPLRLLNDPEFYQNGLILHEGGHFLEDDGDLSDDAQKIGTNSSDTARKCDHSSSFEHHGKKSDDGENDAQDGSCTSSDSGGPVQASRLKNNGCHVWNDYIIDSSDAKVWDGYSLSCPKLSADFLPTNCMIEEVFGDGDFESNGKR